MRPLTDLEREQILHMLSLEREYDPVKAREYYLRTRKLKGRRKGSTSGNSVIGLGKGRDPRTGKKSKQISKDARTKQRKELQEQIKGLEDRLQKLEGVIKKRASEEKSENRKGAAKKERSAKESAKPASAAEKAKSSRENEKYRDKNQQKIKSDAKKDDKAGASSAKGGSAKSGAAKGKSPKVGGGSKKSVSDLKNLATKVRGKIAVAKQKLSAL